ncbi:hypothetical protein Pfo_028587 [Paulownia fortunei]|nr:hypothetical protein Pfo_028587 [Paulownia fortunei]
MASASLVSAVTRRELRVSFFFVWGNKARRKSSPDNWGASGIGECTAKLFSKHGAKVAIADVQDELGHSVVKAIDPSNSTFIHCDVTNEDHVKNAVDKTVSTYGKLDIMFNNAGIADYPKPRIIDCEKTDFERVLSINVTGVFLCMKHAARVMVPERRRHHLNRENLAVELGQFGIRVNCLSPYALATPLATKFLGLDDEGLEHAMNSMANLKGTTLKADDVANAALFLASDDAKYVSGQNLFIDGGFGIVNSAIKLFKYPES